MLPILSYEPEKIFQLKKEEDKTPLKRQAILIKVATSDSAY